MSIQYRLAEATAVVRRSEALTLLALDGRLDPQPAVIEGSGTVICEALRSWASFEELLRGVSEHFEDAPTDEIEAGVRGFIDGLLNLGIVVTRESSERTDAMEHADA